jgi:hypothetical protein
LILDLRSNPGGLLNSAIEIADRFIEEGLIARIQPRFGMPTYVSAHKEKTRPDYPMVVLINRSSASSSEILAGVLQEPKLNWCLTSQETIDTDPQLAIGLLVLKAKMIESGHRLALN